MWVACKGLRAAGVTRLDDTVTVWRAAVAVVVAGYLAADFAATRVGKVSSGGGGGDDDDDDEWEDADSDEEDGDDDDDDGALSSPSFTRFSNSTTTMHGAGSLHVGRRHHRLFSVTMFTKVLSRGRGSHVATYALTRSHPIAWLLWCVGRVRQANA